MFEAKLAEALVLKKIIDAIKDLVTDVNIDATPQGKCTHPSNPLLTKLPSLYRTLPPGHGQFARRPRQPHSRNERIRVLPGRPGNDPRRIHHQSLQSAQTSWKRRQDYFES